MTYVSLIICFISIGLFAPSISFSLLANPKVCNIERRLNQNGLKMTNEKSEEFSAGPMSRKEVLASTGSFMIAGLGMASLARAEESVESVIPEPVQKTKKAANIMVPYNGKDVPVGKFLGSKATLVVNIKIDDPGSLQQMPALVDITQKYGKSGLHVLAFPSDQGYFEPDENDIIRIKNYQVYGFGQYPIAVLFDKIDIVGNTIHPFYQYICSSLKNPYDVKRITLNYEKFLLDADGVPVRRYPRKTLVTDLNVQNDIRALLAGEPLPEETKEFKTSWVQAKREASQSQYAFKKGLNYYDN